MIKLSVDKTSMITLPVKLVIVIVLDVGLELSVTTAFAPVTFTESGAVKTQL